MNLHRALQASVSLETLRRQAEAAYEQHMRNSEEVEAARHVLEIVERKARLSRRRWLDLRIEIKRIEDSARSGNSR